MQVELEKLAARYNATVNSFSGRVKQSIRKHSCGSALLRLQNKHKPTGDNNNMDEQDISITFTIKASEPLYEWAAAIKTEARADSAKRLLALTLDSSSVFANKKDLDSATSASFQDQIDKLTTQLEAHTEKLEELEESIDNCRTIADESAEKLQGVPTDELGEIDGEALVELVSMAAEIKRGRGERWLGWKTPSRFW